VFHSDYDSCENAAVSPGEATCTVRTHMPAGQDLVAILLGHMESRGFETADSQSLSNTLWAVGKLGIRPDPQWMGSCLQVMLYQDTLVV
jgi:hypothetical protein